MRRSSADGRDTYYGLDLARCGELLSAPVSLHPGLAPTRPRAGASAAARSRACCFCARATAPARRWPRRSGAAVGRRGERGQRGQPPQGAAPQRGAGDARARHRHRRASLQAPERVRRRRFDYVISLCDRVREVCPEFPGAPEPIHWSIPDPAREPGSDEETLPAFERTAAELATRIGFLIEAINRPHQQEVTERA